MIQGVDLSGYTPVTGRPKGSKIARKAIREKEFEELMIALDVANNHHPHLLRRHRRAFTLLYHLGMRVGELLMLRIKDLRKGVAEGEMQLEGSKTKTRRSRLLQLSVHGQQALYEAFHEIIKDPQMHDNYFVFFGSNPFRPLNKQNFILRMNEFLHDVLGESYSTHSFRQGLITDMLVKHKMPIVVAQTFIGHSSMMTTARYSSATEEDTMKAINMVR